MGVSDQTSEGILDQFSVQRDVIERFTNHVVTMVGEVLYSVNIKTHSIAGRTKSVDSLRGKLHRGKRIYHNVSEITDLSGVRITTYFANDVDRIFERLRPHYEIDLENSIDKRLALDPDRFGYVSLHFVVRIKRTSSFFNQEFSGLQCEVQIRSVLQHAWAEIEHDLGYKNTNAIPKDLRRRFSRIAALLEVCDVEFDALRDEISRYVAEIRPKVANKALADVDVNKHSIEEYLSHSIALKKIDKSIADSLGVPIESKIPALRVLQIANALEFRSLQQIEDSLSASQNRIIEFAKEWYRLGYSGHVVAVAQGVGLLFWFYFSTALSDSALSPDASRIVALLHRSGMSEKLVVEASTKIISVANSL
jgi:putative GTP pyrophosphokinase